MNKYIYIILAIIPLKLIAVEGVIYEKKIHADSVDSLCLSANAIISGSFDGSIKSTKANESTIIGMHKDWVRKIICSGSNIISASNDGMITIWNDMKKIHSVQAHIWWVTDIALSENKLVSVSLDETVKVWSFPELKLLYSHKLNGSNKHHSVIINNNIAFIGTTSGLIFVLELDNFKWLGLKRWLGVKTITGYNSSLISATKSIKYVFFGTSDGFLIKVLASSPNKISRLKISDFAVKAIAHKQGTLYVGDDNGVIRKINVVNFKSASTINHFSEAVRTLAIDKNLIYAGYDKGYIRIFKSVADKAEIK